MAVEPRRGTRGGRTPRRRTGVAVLVVAAAAVWVGVALLKLLVPPPVPLPATPSALTATCEDPMPRRAPVPVTSGVLFTCPDLFDDRFVVVQGEAVGEVLDGPGDRGWVQVNDDAYAAVGPLPAHGQDLGTNSGVAVLLPAGQRPDVLGGPSTWGDRLRVVGQYQVDARADQGGPAVIAEAVIPLADGGPFDDRPSTALRVTAVVGVVVTAMIGLAVRRGLRTT